MEKLLRRIRYEMSRRALRFRRTDRYLHAHAVIGPIHRVMVKNAAGRLRRLDLRPGTSDFPLFHMTFATHQYGLGGLARYEDIRARYDHIVASGKRPLIIDAGANIGLASLYFRDQFPEAVIAAIEPEAANFAMLENFLADDPLSVPIRAGLANFNGTVKVTDPGLGVVGYRTEKSSNGVPAYRLEAVIGQIEARHAISPFLLKVDIEGFENDLFDNADVFDSFYLAIIELHDWMLPKERTSASFLQMVANLNRDFILQGENVLSVSNTDPGA